MEYKKKTFRERKQEQLDNMRKQVEDENVPLYKRSQLAFKVRELKGKLHPRVHWDSSNGTYRKSKESK